MSKAGRWSGAVALITAALVSLAPMPADAGPKEKAQAKALVAEAKTAAKEKRWSDAAQALEQADQLDPSPQTKLDLGRALAQQGKLVAASKALNAAISTAKGPGGKAVTAAANKVLAEVEPKIPWIQINVVGPPADQTSTTIDGEEVDARSEIPFDPGEHVIVAEADGYERMEKRVKLGEGKHEQVTLTLQKIALAAAPPPKEDEGGGSAIPAVLAFGVGAAGIGVGAVFGIMAFNETSKVESQCQGTRCPPDVQDALDVAKTNGTISTIGFIVGGVGVAAGVVLLLTSGSSDDSNSDEENAGAADQVSVTPFVGPKHIGLVGTF